MTASTEGQIREVRAQELDEMIEDHDDLLIVDVREPHEFHQGHIPGALPVPRDALAAASDPAHVRRIARLCDARERTVVLVSNRGERSALAAATLARLGFVTTYSLAGGTDAWQAVGLPLIAEDR